MTKPKLADLHPKTQEYLRKANLTIEGLEATFDTFAQAVALLPAQLDSKLLGFFISGVLDAYEITAEERLLLLLELAALTPGVDAKVARVDEDGELNLADLGLSASNDDCPCPSCTTERESKAAIAQVGGTLH